MVGCHLTICLATARTSDCDCVIQSRLRSKPLALRRASAMRPSGFWQMFTSTTSLARIFLVVASFENESLRMRRRPASTPVVSPPWMLQLMNTGARRSPPRRSMARAASGSVVCKAMKRNQRFLAAGEAHFFWIVTRYSGCPPADLAICVKDMRALRLSMSLRMPRIRE
ncbi:MAG: hypothetical protein BWY94_01986 [Actinobacteria bacterium ADurb.BinA094]|nr:MAG: hypothetical protein BWY94_01986 [Actinobacteria bacterium ADurb.BinA094]